MMNALFSDLSREYQSKPVPPEPHRLGTYIDDTLKDPIFNLPQRQRIAVVHQHCETNDFGRTVEIADRI